MLRAGPESAGPHLCPCTRSWNTLGRYPQCGVMVIFGTKRSSSIRQKLGRKMGAAEITYGPLCSPCLNAEGTTQMGVCWQWAGYWAWVSGQELFGDHLSCWEFIRGMCQCLSSEILHCWLSMAEVCTWTSCTGNEKLSDMKNNWSLRSITENAQWQISLWSLLFFPVFHDEERTGWHVSKATLPLVTRGERLCVHSVLWSKGKTWSCRPVRFRVWNLGSVLELRGSSEKRVVIKPISMFHVFPLHLMHLEMHNQLQAAG